VRKVRLQKGWTQNQVAQKLQLYGWDTSRESDGRNVNPHPACGHPLALIVLPSLIVGNELLILAGVASAVGLWFFAYRHGSLRGLVNATQSPAPTSTQTTVAGMVAPVETK
jgi:hypothetical protein